MAEVTDNGRRDNLMISFRSEDDILNFVDTCNHYDDAVDVVWKKMKIDAKSVLGMLQLPYNEELALEYCCFDDEDNYREFFSDVTAHYQVTVK